MVLRLKTWESRSLPGLPRHHVISKSIDLFIVHSKRAAAACPSGAFLRLECALRGDSLLQHSACRCYPKSNHHRGGKFNFGKSANQSFETECADMAIGRIGAAPRRAIFAAPPELDR